MADSTQIRDIKGVGSYAPASSHTWGELFNAVHAPEHKLGFTPARHALFDGVIAQQFPTLGAHDLAGKLNGPLRENIACVRNYLMSHYYETAPEGMTPEKARESLKLISRYIGEGLQWNEQVRGGKASDPFKAFINIDEASAPNAEGARYLYKKIMEMDRQSSWVKPFTKVMELTKGKSDLALLPLDETPFAYDDHSDEERLREQLEEAAMDLDILGDQLIAGAARAGAIGNMSEPVRREAIDLAKEILNKLKVKLGSLNIIDGLNINPEDTATMGSISGVLAMFDRLLAYARSIDPSILMHPAIMSAIQAFGQIGYLNKQEAMRLATSSKNNKMAERIAGQLKRTSAQFGSLNDKRFGALTDRINKGIDTVLEKTQEIAGPSALVGHSISQNISSFMTTAPTAGMANKLTHQTQQRTIAAHKGDEAVDRANADRILQAANQAAQRSNREQQQETQRRATNSRQVRQQAQRNLRQSQQLQSQRIHVAEHAHDHDHHHPNPAQQQQQKTAADVAKQIDPRILMGFQNATNTSNIKTGMVTPKNAKDVIATNLQGTNASGGGSLKPPATPPKPVQQPPLMPGTTERGSMANPGDTKTESAKISEDQQKKRVDNEMLMQPPPPPPNRGGGRGF